MKKTMKKIFVMMMSLLAAAGCFAQNEAGRWTLTPKVGVNMATLTDPDIYVDNNEKMEYCNKVGFVVGGEVEYQLNRLLGLSTGLLYSSQGTGMKDNSAFRDASLSLDYLNVPLTANIYFAPDVAVRIGVQAGWAVRRHQEGDENIGNGHWQHNSTDDTNYRSFDLSLPIGLSWNIGAVQLDARYNLGLTNVTEYKLMKMRNRVLQLTVGYRFEL